MTLIRCPECKKRTSESAVSCPSCGYVLSAKVVKRQKVKERNDQMIGIGCFILLAPFFFFCFGSCLLIPNRRSTDLPPVPSYYYNDSDDKHLKDLPSLRGYSNSEKEQIISAAKKLDARIKEIEKERGF